MHDQRTSPQLGRCALTDDADDLPKSGEMDPVDLEALERALAIGLKEHSAQIRQMLDEEGWELASKFSAYSAQCDALGLAPWEAPPISWLSA